MARKKPKPKCVCCDSELDDFDMKNGDELDCGHFVCAECLMDGSTIDHVETCEFFTKSDEPYSFTYEGDDSMIDLNKEEIPEPHPDFKATLKYRIEGEIVEKVADTEYRKKIWEWWYDNRRDEIRNSVIKDVANQLLGYGKYGTLI